MNNLTHANRLSGRAIGSIFFACFGAAWFILALAARQSINAITIASTLIGTAALVMTAVYLLFQAKRWPQTPDSPSMRRGFAWINALQWTAIILAAVLLTKAHLSPYVPPVIAGIVGLHMFPLARLFRYSPHYVTGASLVVWAFASALLSPVAAVQGNSALGTGIILWLSAVVMLSIGIRAARQKAPAEVGKRDLVT